MSWAQRLEAIRKNAKGPGGELPKVPKVGSVTFGTPPDGVSEKISAPQTDPAPRQQAAGCNVLFLRRSVTCATCLHQERRPDTSSAGMHDCAKGHGLRFAYYPHDCYDWRPRP